MVAGGGNPDVQNPQLDWLQAKRRVQLLPHNPYFQERLVASRRALGLPNGGLQDEDAAYDWLGDHILEQDPYWFTLWAVVGPIPTAALVRKVAHRMAVYPRAEPNALEHTYILLDAFQLLPSVFGRLLWLLVANEQIPETMLTNSYVEVVEPPEVFPEDNPHWIATQEAIYDSYCFGLPDVDGDLVVIKLIVNEYTTKREVTDAWEYVKEVRDHRLQGRKLPHRRRAGHGVEEQFDRWILWWNARHEGDSLLAIADQWGVAEESIRYALDQLEQLMRPAHA